MTFTGGGVGRRGACHMKKPHATAREARLHLQALVARGAYEPSMKIKRCPYGKQDHFHVAHRIAKDGKGKRS